MSLSALHDADPDVRHAAIEHLVDKNAVHVMQVIDNIAAENNPRLRLSILGDLSAAFTIVNGVGNFPNAALDRLVEMVRPFISPSEPAELQEAAVDILSKIAYRARSADSAMPQILLLLSRSRSAEVRASSASALGSFEERGVSAVDALVDALSDSTEAVREAAATSLGEIGPGAAPAVDSLRQLLRSSATSKRLRLAALSSLGDIGDASALPELRKALDDPDLQYEAVGDIGELGPAARAAEPDLVRLLNDASADKSGNDWLLGRLDFVLAKIGAEAGGTAAVLERSFKLRDKETLATICSRKPNALSFLIGKLDDQESSRDAVDLLLAVSLSLAGRAERGSLSPATVAATIPLLQTAIARIEAMRPPPRDAASALEVLRLSVEKLDAGLKRGRWVGSILTNRWLFAVAIYGLTWLALFWFAPLRLLALSETLDSVKVRLPWLDGPLCLGNLVLLRYHKRVLDAWVASHLGSARASFGARRTVQDRKVHIPLPVILNDRTISQLTPGDLRPIFTRHRSQLLISGEGGAGKTSLACVLAEWAMSEASELRIANHRMLPILIEENIELPLDASDSSIRSAFLAAIQGQLMTLIDIDVPTPDPFFERLLRRQRLLVIVDHLSEMNEVTRRAVRPDSPQFLPSALIVTARTPDMISKVIATTLEPLRIQGDRTVSFLDAYFKQRGKSDLFPTDADLFEACQLLARMVGRRNITVLLAKIYAEQLIYKRESVETEVLPTNIPDLMLSYINELNRSLTVDRLDERLLHRTASIIAWECLRQSFRAAPALRTTVLAACGDGGENILAYLETRIHLVETIGAARDKVRITLDPLAEYLAAIHVVEHAVASFEERLSEISDAAPIEGFLLAVKDSYLAKVPGAHESDHLPAAISRLLQRDLAKPA
jgi:HEAT repeat protein